MRHVLSCLVLASVLSCGCVASSNSPSGTLPLAITLAVGQQTTVSGLSVTFVAVTADSRCPMDAFCVTAGDATLQFDLSTSQRAARYDLQVARSDKRLATHEGFAVEVQTLAPYPSSGKAIRQDEYRATVRVSRQGSGIRE